MARDFGFDPNEPDEDLDAAALLQQLGTKPPSLVAPGDAPTSNTMPVGASTVPSPAPAPKPADNFSRMTGYDQGNWGNGMDSLKYNAGRILSRYAANPTGMAQALQDEDFKKLAPNARLTGSNSDVLDFGGQFDKHSGARIGKVDVGRNFDARNPNAEDAWQWIDLENQESAPASGPAPTPGAPRVSVPSPLTIDGPQESKPSDTDPMAAILEEIEALQNGGASPMDQQALMQLLGI